MLFSSFIYIMFPYDFYENNMWDSAENPTNYQDSYEFSHLQTQLFFDEFYFD